MNERNVDGAPGYVVFFDNIRVDKYVTGFRTNIGTSVGMGTASLDMIYVPDFYQPVSDDVAGDSIVEQGFENMTTVRIFNKNMFSNKYTQVFEGNLRAGNRTRTPNGFSLSFQVTDYMTWLNRTIVPLAIPQSASYRDQLDILRWRAQGIDTTKINQYVTQLDTNIKGKTFKEFVGLILQTTMRNNTLFSDPNTVAQWDNCINRIHIMGDISQQLVSSQTSDFMLSTNSTSLNSIYVAVNDIAKNLMFEFYQDRDGIIRVKPPFWNEGVLRDHVIDPILIIGCNESTDFNNLYTRVSVTGNLEEEEINNSSAAPNMFAPAAVYVGSLDGSSKDVIVTS